MTSLHQLRGSSRQRAPAASCSRAVLALMLTGLAVGGCDCGGTGLDAGDASSADAAPAIDARPVGPLDAWTPYDPTDSGGPTPLQPCAAGVRRTQMRSPVALGPTASADAVEGDGDVLRATITTPGATSVDVRYVAFDRVSGDPLLVSDPVAVPSALSRRAYRISGSSVTVLAFTPEPPTAASSPPGLIAQRWTVDATGHVGDATLYTSDLSLRILAADGSSGSSGFVAIGALEETDGTGQLVVVSLGDVLTTRALMSIPRVADMTADAACDATGSCTLVALASDTAQAELVVAAIDDTAAPPAVDVSVVERVPPPPLLPSALRVERFGALAAISLGVTQATPDDPRSAIGGRVIV